MYLERATDQPFTVSRKASGTKGGIRIVLQTERLTGAADNIEAYLFKGNREDLTITAGHPLGLSRGVYAYLHGLGFRWYLPGHEWELVPTLKNITLNKTVDGKPAFSLRNFFGTGGFPSLPRLDPEGALEQRWNDWKRRNRFGGEFHPSGHYGETFNLKYRTLLEKNPAYLAQVSGRRVWSETAKWCIGNPDLRALFVSDRVQDLEATLKTSAYGNEKIVLTVDPADGYGDCECEKCRRLGTLNNRIFLLANEAAVALRKRSPRAYANIYAYNTHPSPPSFALSPNLIVQVIPYAFQNIAAPEELISLWRKKHNNLYIYDYYGIPDWHQDQPLTDGWNTELFFHRLPRWQSSGIRGFIFETSYAAGCTGPGLYVAGRLGWEGKGTPQTVLQEFYRDMFGTAAADIALYFQKMNNGFSGSADLSFLLHQLQKASAATSDPQVLQRLTELKAYVHYLVLYYRHTAAGTAKAEALENLLQYVYSIYPRGIISSAYLAMLLGQQLPAGSEASKRWALANSENGSTGGVRPLSNEYIEQAFRQDLREHLLLDGYAYLTPRNRVGFALSKTPTDNGRMKEGLMILNMPETVVKSNAAGALTFSLKVNESSSNNESQTVTVQLADMATNKTVAKRKVKINKVWLPLRFALPAGKVYKLVINNTNWIRFAAPPTQWLAFRNIPTYAVMGTLWFYNPPGSPYLYFSNNATEGPVVKDEGGRSLIVQKVNELSLFRVALQTGWYAVESSEYKHLRFLNPHLLFFPYRNMVVQ